MTQAPSPFTPQPGGTMKPHRGTTVLIVGILGFFCIFAAIAAWVMGKKDLQEMDAGLMDPSGRSMTNAGKICGIVFTILGVLGIILNIALRVASH